MTQAQEVDLGRLYTPYPGQAAMHASDARIKVIEVARRYGKSRFALFELLRRYTEALDVSVPSSIVPPFHAWIVCPSYPQARQVWNEIISLMPREFRADGGVHQDEMFIYLAGKEGREWGLLEIKSAHNAEALQTVGLDFLWVNEAQDITDAAFEKLLPTLRSPSRMSYAVFEGIPSLHADHWFRRVYRLAEEGRPGYAAFKYTFFDRPEPQREEFKSEQAFRGAKAEYEETMRQVNADRDLLRESTWRRMYLAEFSESAGYFSEVGACISGDLLPEPIPGCSYVAGLDLGRKVDATVLHVLDRQARRLVHHRSWDAGQNWVIQREAVAHDCSVWKPSRLICDATGMGGDIFTQELADMGVPVEPFTITGGTAGGSRERLLNELAVSLERGTVSFPPVPGLLRQLRAFQHRKLPSGLYRVEAPPGEHDDEVFALALGLLACDAPQPLLPSRPVVRESRLPTQEEAMGAVRRHGPGAWRMRERRLERARARQEKAGIR